jgi:CubicO group peptidase (beta-lactamase class C family)
MSDIQSRIQQVESGLISHYEPTSHKTQAYSLSERMAEFRVPGVSVAVINGGKLDWAKGYGVRAAGEAGTVDTETLFQAASISKTVAALAILRLFEARGLSLDADVNDYLKSWRVPPVDGWQPRLTLRLLLSHSAGTTVHGFLGYSHTEAVPTLVQLLDGAAPANSDPVRVDTVPGTQFRYSGGGTSIAQQVAMDITGKPFNDIAREFVFEPLGMTRSLYEHPVSPPYHANAARAHYSTGARVEGNWHIHPELAAAGLWTTPTDILRMALAIQSAYKGEASPVSQDVASAMLTAAIRDETYRLGLGTFLNEANGLRQFGHGGDNVGYKNSFKAYYDNEFGVDGGYAIMTNGDQGDPLIQEIVASLTRAYGWEDVQPNVSLNAPIPADWCVGTYRLASGFNFAVALKGDTMSIQPDGQAPLELEPFAGTQFHIAALKASVTFEIEAGSAYALVFEQNGKELRAGRV